MPDDRRTGFSDSDLGRLAEAVQEAVAPPPPTRAEFRGLERRVEAIESKQQDIVRTEERQRVALRQLSFVAKEVIALREENDQLRTRLQAVDDKQSRRTMRLHRVMYAYKRRLWIPTALLFGSGTGAGYMLAVPEVGGKILGKVLEMVAKGLLGG